MVANILFEYDLEQPDCEISFAEIAKSFASFPEKIPQYVQQLHDQFPFEFIDLIGYFGHTFSDDVLNDIIHSPTLNSINDVRNKRWCVLTSKREKIDFVNSL